EWRARATSVIVGGPVRPVVDLLRRVGAGPHDRGAPVQVLSLLAAFLGGDTGACDTGGRRTPRSGLRQCSPGASVVDCRLRPPRALPVGGRGARARCTRRRPWAAVRGHAPRARVHGSVPLN